MYSISAVILTKNEQLNLARAVRSLEWCAEVIVVDSGSDDGTIGLAKSLGCCVIQHKEPGAFNIQRQRNWILDSGFIHGVWTLFLDADEVVTPELKSEILRAVSKPEVFDAYELTPKYLFWGKWLRRTQGYPNWHSRLLKTESVRFEGGVWECFAQGVKVGRIHEPYLHFANSKGMSDWLTRHDRYSSWDAKCICDYWDTHSSDSLATTRKLRMRVLAARFFYLRPFVRFIHMYIFRFGILEGFQALLFCLLYFVYEFMIVVKVLEMKRIKKGLDL